MEQYFASHVTNALLLNDSATALEYYNRAKTMPSTETHRRLLRIGVEISEQAHAIVHTNIVLFGHKNGIPCAVKMLRDREELQMLQNLRVASLQHDNIVNFEIEDGRFQVMPHFVSNLQEINHFDAIMQDRMWVHLSDAMMYLHGKGYAHMDIKPENVGIRESGSPVLLDAEAITLFDQPAFVTEMFVPLEFTVRHGKTISSALVSWWMLAVTFAIKMDFKADHDADTAAAAGVLKKMTSADSLLNHLDDDRGSIDSLSTQHTKERFSKEQIEAKLADLHPQVLAALVEKLDGR